MHRAFNVNINELELAQFEKNKRKTRNLSLKKLEVYLLYFATIVNMLLCNFCEHKQLTT